MFALFGVAAQRLNQIKFLYCVPLSGAFFCFYQKLLKAFQVQVQTHEINSTTAQQTAQLEMFVCYCKGSLKIVFTSSLGDNPPPSQLVLFPLKFL